MTASGLAAATSLAYTAPGTPWARADVLAPPTSAEVIQGPAAAGPDATADPTGSAAPLTPMDMEHEAATAYSGIIRAPGRTVLVDVSPAVAGINTIAVTVLDAKSAPAKVEEWSATASLPGGNVPDVAVPLKTFGDGAATAAPDLPVAGKWLFTITVHIAGADPATFTHVVPIAP